MKIFITGINGQLGTELKIAAITNNIEVVGCGRSNSNLSYYYQLDLINEIQTKQIIEQERPDVVIHCAAWTDVNNAELGVNKNKVYNSNVYATQNIVEACKNINCKLIYISTDYIFDGTGNEPHKITEKANPLNYYGYTKYLGETKIITYNKSFIVRISWVYGKYGNNFVKTMLKLANTNNELTVINDQIGRPTYTKDLAELLLNMCYSNKYGIYHACNSGENISWYDFSKEILKNKNIIINGISTAEYYKNKNIANRPLNSRLDTSNLLINGFNELPVWKESLYNFLKG